MYDKMCDHIDSLTFWSFKSIFDRLIWQLVRPLKHICHVHVYQFSISAHVPIYFTVLFYEHGADTKSFNSVCKFLQQIQYSVPDLKECFSKKT